MRQLLLVLALMSAFVFSTRAADDKDMATNSIVADEAGTLEIVAPKDWTFTHTNMQMTGNPPSMELHSPSNVIAIRITVYWDGFRGQVSKLDDQDFDKIVSNVVKQQYLPVSVEKKFVVEKLKGPGVSGSFARITDAKWSPVMKGAVENEFKNLATGMFRCGNLWGNFDLLTNDKDGPPFKQGLKVLESLHKKK